MPAVKLDQFGGALPAWDPRLLPQGQAASSVNGYLFSGALKGWRKPKVLRSLLNSAAKFVFRIPVVTEQQALAYLVFKAQPVAGDSLVIGENGYIFRTAITSTNPPGDVLIGATANDTAANLIAAITADNGTNVNAGILYGLNTLANNSVKWYTEDADISEGLAPPGTASVNIASVTYTYVQVGSVDFGAAYNSVPVSESTGGARTVWLQDMLSFSDTTTTFKGGANSALSNSVTAPSVWLEFLDADTNVVKSQVVDDVYKRYYTASPSLPPSYNTYDRIVEGKPFWRLGVPAPGCAPEVSVTGGGNNVTYGHQTASTDQTQVAGVANSVFLIPVTPAGATLLTNVSFTASASGVPPITTVDFEADGGAVAGEASVLDGTNVVGNFQGVVYTDNNGQPGSLFAVGDMISTGLSEVDTNAATFTNPVGLQAETTYWIGIATDAAFNFALAIGPPTDMATFTNTFSNGPPATPPAAMSTDQSSIAMWMTGQSDDILEARSYVYTWVSAYGEEGPPSPAALLNGWSNGVWDVKLTAPVASDMGVLRNLTSINLYRTVVSDAGSAVFFFVDSVPIGTDQYEDVIPDNTVALNSQLPSTNWFPPPDNLQGIVTMPNGIMAGFTENQLWFSDPYHPHAWPPGFVLTTEFPIVGLGVTNSALVVATATVPYIVVGQTPDSFALTKCDRPNPCTSRGSIVGGDAFVTYHSPNGLIQVTPTGIASNTTDLWFTRENWKTLTPQEYVRAVFMASCYFAFGTTSPSTVVPSDNSVAQKGFTIELDQDNQSFTIWPQPGGHRLGFNQLTSHTGFDIDNVLIDAWTGVGLLVSNGQVYYYDFADTSPQITTYTYRSKTYQQNAKRNYEAMKVFFKVPPGHAALNPTRMELPATDPAWETLPDDRYGYIKTYADWAGDGKLTLIDCREIRSSGELLRIVSGFKTEQWAWEIMANVEIANVQVATSAKELANV